MNQTEVEERLLTDFPYYAENNLMIKPKIGAFIPFAFNKAQMYIHQRLEQQKKETGRVRALILKGRQQGCSTYVGARYYHRTVSRAAFATFIFAHDSDGSDSLFTMVKNYYDYSDEKFRPILGKSNSKELLFPKLGSGYKVGTAGSKGLGRSKTFQSLHWSEVAYSDNCEKHSAGIIQTVVDADDTEIILESTSAGQGDYFHRMCMSALSGQSDYQLIFVPWFWQDEYKRPVPADFELGQPEEEQISLSEQEYFDLFERDGFTLEHISWRRNKINSDFQGDVMKFLQEYPFTPQEAFQVDDVDSYIKLADVLKARNTPYIQTEAPLIIGVDPARLGKDRICISHRKGRNLRVFKRLPKMKITELAQALALEIIKYNPTKMFIDVGGLGVGVYDILVDMGYSKIVTAVNFGGKATLFDRYANKRAEMYGEAKEWLADGPVHINNENPRDADALQAELCGVRKSKKPQRNQELLLEPKEDMKARGMPSPDIADSFVLTFAFPVAGVNHARRQGNMVLKTGFKL